MIIHDGCPIELIEFAKTGEDDQAAPSSTTRLSLRNSGDEP
jgi:hypothetical protein